MTSPAEVAARFDAVGVAAGSGCEELRGFAVMSLPFLSGDVLCLRSWPASSFGPAYNSVWHRSPSGDWTAYHSAPANVSCPRYVGAALSQAIETPVRLEWIGERHLRVNVDVAGLVWDLDLGSTLITRVMNAMLAMMPPSLLRSNAVLSMMSAMSTVMFAAGRVPMRGTFPNRQWFQAQPRRVWMVTSSRASLGGRDLGLPGPLPAAPTIGDIPLPQKGIFMVGSIVTEAWSPARHLRWTSRVV